MTRPRLLLALASSACLAAGLTLGLREARGVVLAVDGRPVEDAAQLRNELARAEVGARLDLSILRGGKRREISVPVEEATGDA